MTVQIINLLFGKILFWPFYFLITGISPYSFGCNFFSTLLTFVIFHKPYFFKESSYPIPPFVEILDSFSRISMELLSLPSTDPRLDGSLHYFCCYVPPSDGESSYEVFLVVNFHFNPILLSCCRNFRNCSFGLRHMVSL